MDPKDFAELLTAHQAQLHAFVFAQVMEPNLAADVLQETNRVLLEKSDAFEARRDFLPWAFTFARNQVRAERTRLGRERWVLEEDVAETVADRMEQRLTGADRRQLALAECLERLEGTDRTLLDRRYSEGISIEELSASLGRSATALGTHLHRLRGALAECIRGRMTAAGGRG